MTLVCANEECAQPLRRVNVRAEDAPGTLQYAARGLCKRCYNHSEDTLTPQQLKQAQSALDAWLNARRNRLRSKEAPCVKRTKPSKRQHTNSNKCGAAASSTTDASNNYSQPTANTTRGPDDALLRR